MIDFAKLSAPFPADRVSWRVGSTTKDKSRGMALAYFDARDAMARLDEVCGPGGWQCRYPHAAAKTVCEIGIKVSEHDWVWKADGAGDSDVEAEKGALSDAFKRAAVRWGIGRYLYDVDSPWVALEAAGNSYKIAASEMPKLQASLARAAGQPARQPSPPPAARPPVTDHGPKPPPPSTPRRPLVNTGDTSDWATIAQDIERTVKACKSNRDVDVAMSDLTKPLAAMKTHDPDRYNAVGAMVRAHRASLQQSTAVAG